MCEIVDKIEARGEDRGEARGLQILVSTLRELGHSDSLIINEIMKRYKMSGESAERYLT